MYKYASYNSKEENNQQSLKRLIRRSFLCEKHVAKQGVSPCASFYSGKSKCKMIPFNKGSHMNTLRRGEEREQAGRCLYSCFHFLMTAEHFPQCWLFSRVAFVRLPGCAVRPGQRSQEGGSLELLLGFCFACSSLFSVADIHANGFHSSVSLVLLGCIVQSGNTMSVRGIGSNIFQRSVELHWYH